MDLSKSPSAFNVIMAEKKKSTRVSLRVPLFERVLIKTINQPHELLKLSANWEMRNYSELWCPSENKIMKRQALQMSWDSYDRKNSISSMKQDWDISAAKGLVLHERKN